MIDRIPAITEGWLSSSSSGTKDLRGEVRLPRQDLRDTSSGASVPGLRLWVLLGIGVPWKTLFEGLRASSFSGLQSAVRDRVVLQGPLI